MGRSWRFTFWSLSQKLTDAIIYNPKIWDTNFLGTINGEQAQFMHKEQNSVSIIIPTYNRLKYTVKAIDSALSQKFQHIEIIVVDDGSVDNTRRVLNENYGDKIKYIHQANRGPAAARNTGIENASFEFIAFLDSDDIWLPEKLELQMPIFDDPDVVLVYSNWFDSADNSRKDYFSSIGINCDNDVDIFNWPLEELLKVGGSGIWTTTCICRKDKLKKVGAFDERMKIAEDIRLWFRLAMEGKFASVKTPLAIRRWTHSKNQLTQQEDISYLRESADLRLEVFMETYARVKHHSPQIQKRLRAFIGKSLAEQSKYLALDGKYRLARIRALDSIHFNPCGKSVFKAFISFLFPYVFKFKKRSRSMAS